MNLDKKIEAINLTKANFELGRFKSRISDCRSFSCHAPSIAPRADKAYTTFRKNKVSENRVIIRECEENMLLIGKQTNATNGLSERHLLGLMLKHAKSTNASSE